MSTCDTGRTVTRVADTAVPDADFQVAWTVFSEKQLVDLNDPGVLPINGEYLHERLPHNKFDMVNAGHFP